MSAKSRQSPLLEFTPRSRIQNARFCSTLWFNLLKREFLRKLVPRIQAVVSPDHHRKKHPSKDHARFPMTTHLSQSNQVTPHTKRERILTKARCFQQALWAKLSTSQPRLTSKWSITRRSTSTIHWQGGPTKSWSASTANTSSQRCAASRTTWGSISTRNHSPADTAAKNSGKKETETATRLQESAWESETH